MQLSEDQLRAWMTGGLDGDASAHIALLRALAPMLRNFYRRRLRGAEDDIEDLVQETLIAVHTRRASYDRDRPFVAWLYAIARYRMIDHLRRRRGPHRRIRRQGLGPSRDEGARRAHPGGAAMNTDDLIRALGRDVPAIHRGALRRRILGGLGGGGVLSLLFIAFGLGFRPDLWIAMHGFAFWMKGAYTISLGLVAIAATIRLARPDPMPLRLLWLLAVPVLLLAGLCIGELAHEPARDWLAMWLGGSWKVCPWLVLTLSVPIFTGLLWSFRRLAPTRLRATGAAAGLAAGASAATLYCFHCGEVSALFVLTWYSLGIALAAGLGALAGPRLLRW